jgi:hypothetical protein
VECTVEDIRQVLFRDLDAYDNIYASTNIPRESDYAIAYSFVELMANHLDMFVKFPIDDELSDNTEMDYTNKADVRCVLGNLINCVYRYNKDMARSGLVDLINHVCWSNRKYHLKEELIKLEEDKK